MLTGCAWLTTKLQATRNAFETAFKLLKRQECLRQIAIRYRFVMIITRKTGKFYDSLEATDCLAVKRSVIEGRAEVYEDPSFFLSIADLSRKP